MNVRMTKRAYDKSPDRQTYKGLPIRDVLYKDTAHPGMVFRANYRGPHDSRFEWWAFKVDFTDGM